MPHIQADWPFIPPRYGKSCAANDFLEKKMPDAHFSLLH